jgi:hypothetical protein
VKVAKVKKRTGVTGERNVKGNKRNTAGKSKTRKVGTSSRPSAKRKRAEGDGKSTRKKVVRSMRNTKVVTATKAAYATKVAVASPATQRVAIKPLDPLRKCGPNTSVQFLYRVDESVDGRITAHLVFFDRHGWYCEHGRTCPAVGHAKKYNGQIARVS